MAREQDAHCGAGGDSGAGCKGEGVLPPPRQARLAPHLRPRRETCVPEFVAELYSTCDWTFTFTFSFPFVLWILYTRNGTVRTWTRRPSLDTSLLFLVRRFSERISSGEYAEVRTLHAREGHPIVRSLSLSPAPSPLPVSY